jgi:hypothetical protein
MSPPQADGRPLPPDEARPQATNRGPQRAMFARWGGTYGSRLKQKRPRRPVYRLRSTCSWVPSLEGENLRRSIQLENIARSFSVLGTRVIGGVRQIGFRCRRSPVSQAAEKI